MTVNEVGENAIFKERAAILNETWVAIEKDLNIALEPRYNLHLLIGVGNDDRLSDATKKNVLFYQRLLGLKDNGEVDQTVRDQHVYAAMYLERPHESA